MQNDRSSEEGTTSVQWALPNPDSCLSVTWPCHEALQSSGSDFMWPEIKRKENYWQIKKGNSRSVYHPYTEQVINSRLVGQSVGHENGRPRLPPVWMERQSSIGSAVSISAIDFEWSGRTHALLRRFLAMGLWLGQGAIILVIVMGPYQVTIHQLSSGWVIYALGWNTPGNLVRNIKSNDTNERLLSPRGGPASYTQEKQPFLTSRNLHKTVCQSSRH